MQGRYFEDEIRPHLKHKRKGLLGMAGACNGVAMAMPFDCIRLQAAC